MLPFSPPLLVCDALAQLGLFHPHPCGKRGSCGKCAVTLTGEVSPPNAAEVAAGCRLSCQAMLLGDATVTVAAPAAMVIETAFVAVPHGWDDEAHGLGAAVDIGTTTVALSLVDFDARAVLVTVAVPNPQRGIAADVMGRIQAALDGKAAVQQRQIEGAVAALLAAACQKAERAESDVSRFVITGNTTMLYLLVGRSPEPLAHAPFAADDLFGRTVTFLGRPAYLPPCMSAFVGADITCALLASGLCRRKETAMLCDIGTNGEIALWQDGELFVTSTAAGPAFEGAGISCGCGSVAGAVDRVFLENGVIKAHTIGEMPPVGLCGSGLLDAVAVLLDTGAIDETGATDEDTLIIADGVALLPQDIRAVQLAKAAVAAGMDTLLHTADTDWDNVEKLYIAGGFGSHLNRQSGVRIGLLPPLSDDRMAVLGNAALAGALALLCDSRFVDEATRIAENAKAVSLGGSAYFNNAFAEQMFFPEE